MQGLLIKKLRIFFGFSSNKCKRDEPCLNLKKPVPSSDLDSLSLGISVKGEKMCVFIPESTKFPIKVEKCLTNSSDCQSRIFINVYEGASSLVWENTKLGYLLVRIPPAPKGKANFKVCFDVDANGTLKVSAVDTISSELMKEITITSDQRRSAKMVNAKNKLKNYADDIKKTLVDARYKGKLNEADKKKIMKAANKVVEWLNKNESAKVFEYQSRQKELEALWNPIVTVLYQDAAARGRPSPPPKKVKPDSRSPAPSKAGSVLNEVD